MKPAREHATNNSQTYFVTSKTWDGRALFRAEPWARLFFRTLLSHRGKAYLLHEFVLMPDHFHLLITPLTSLERAVQLIKGGFSFRAKRELGSNAEIWQRGFSDHRIRNSEDFEKHVQYIRLNPVKKHLCERAEEYKYSSAYPGWKLDRIPQGLKPQASQGVPSGTTKVVPFQNDFEECDTDRSEPFQNKFEGCDTDRSVAFQNKFEECDTDRSVAFQNDFEECDTDRSVAFQNKFEECDTDRSEPFQNKFEERDTDESLSFQIRNTSVSNFIQRR